MSGADVRIGQVLRARYRIEALLGVGGMATVYRGAHRNGHRVAIKILHAHLAANTDVCGRFLKEGYVANAVDHVGAVRVLDDDVTDDGIPFLVMELLDGESLESRFVRAGSKLPAQDVMAFAWQLLDVLAAAHEKGIVHRDIKPENLFVTKQNHIKVLDFGIARMREAAQSLSATRTGRMMGTPAYMPPEQALGLTKEIDARTDLWAVGATVYTLVSGALVQAGAETVEQMLVFAATRPARSLAAAAPDAPATLVPIVDRALAFDRHDRYPDARAMQTDLASAYHDVFGEMIPAARTAVLTPAPPPPPFGRTRPLSEPPVRAAAFVRPPPPHDAQLARVTELPASVFDPPAATERYDAPPGVLRTSISGVARDGGRTGARSTRTPILVAAAAIVVLVLLVAGKLLFISPAIVQPDAAELARPSASVTLLETDAAILPTTPRLAENANAPSPVTAATTAPPANARVETRAQPAIAATAAPRAPSSDGGVTVRPAPAARVDCTVPKYIDPSGRERWKPECVK